MTDEVGPLPVSVSEYVAENHDATPDEVLAAADLPEAYRDQVEHYCAVSRLAYFGDREQNDDEGLRFNRVEWSDVADWDVSPEK